jgi:hypothetical protein
MNTTIQKESRGHHIEWLTGIVGGLFFISLGFELLARQVFGHTDVGTLLWALYLGSWSFVLGTTGLLLLAMQWLIEWRHVQTNPVTMNRQFSVESTSDRFEKSEMEAPFPALQQSMTSPDRPSWECHDRNEPDGQIRHRVNVTSSLQR